MLFVAESKKSSNRAFNAFLGWGITTLLLWLFNRGGSSSDISNQQASKYTDSNSNQIGDTIPVVLGRGLIKNPLISFYGDFRADIYTEEYGMHCAVPWASILAPLLLQIIVTLAVPNKVIGFMGPGLEVSQGAKNAMIMQAVFSALMLILTKLFSEHMGRTTIQKGFKYYLGWQHILCWTGDNIGIKRLWMNVYDSDVEESTNQGVWDNNSHIAWKSDNPYGIVAHIDNEDMFGGVDEGGGFIGDVRFYFGTEVQPNDSWMIDQMSKSEGVPVELKGLTPKYPMFLTAVIPTAYIGKQATIPEMWFEVVNYPNNLYSDFKYDLQGIYNEYIDRYLLNILDYLNSQSSDVQSYLSAEIGALNMYADDYKNKANDSSDLLKQLDDARDYLENVKLHYSDNPSMISDAQKKYDDCLHKFNVAQGNTEATFSSLKGSVNALVSKYPPTKKNEFENVANPLIHLLDLGLWHLSRLGDDLNPAEAIYEILTNHNWGCDYKPISKIDIKSLLRVAVVCEEEELGISALINNQQQAYDYIDKILSHINGVKFDNPYTGKLEFRLIRNDYSVNDLPVFDTSNCASLSFSRLDWSETVSEVSVRFTHADNKYEEGQLKLSDLANTFLTGTHKSIDVDGSYFTIPSTAKAMAESQLLSAGYPLASVSIECNRIGHNRVIGEPILVSWKPYGIEKQVFRITNIDYGSLTSGAIKIDAIEDVFGFEQIDYSFSDSPSWTEPENIPEDVTSFYYLELPYEKVMSFETYVDVYAARPSMDSIYWNVWRYIAPTYTKTNRAISWSTVGNLVYGYSEDYPFDSAGFEISPVGTGGRELIDAKIDTINSDNMSYNHKSGLNLAVIDNEIISYDKIVKSPNGNYLVKGVVRGVYDTVPTMHVASTNIYFLEFRLNSNGNKPVCYAGDSVHEQYEITTDSSTMSQPFDDGKVYHYTTRRRTEAPSIMANLQFAADRGATSSFKYNYPPSTVFSHDIDFNFIPRNKFEWVGIVEQTDNTLNINVADDTLNVLGISCNGVDFEVTYDGVDKITGDNNTSFKLLWSEYCKNMGARLQDIGDVTLSIMTYNSSKSIYSYDKYVKNIRYEVPRLVGIVASHSDVQTYADTIVQSTIIQVPSAGTYPVLTLTYEECALIFVGNLSTTGYGFHNQVNDVYDIYDQAYRVDGVDTSGKAIIHKVDIQEYYTIRTDFTATGTSLYYRYTTGAWSLFNIYI